MLLFDPAISSSSSRNPGQYPEYLICQLKAVRGDFKIEGHDWHLIRENRELLGYEPEKQGVACGKHIICRCCGEEIDLTNLEALSPLEQLALCAK